MLKWTEGPTGQHIELGICEMNLFLLLGQLGMSWDISDQPLLPIGTVYDPFVCRGLDAFIYSTYSGSRSSSPGPRRASRWRPRAVRTSRRSPRRSASSCRASR